MPYINHEKRLLVQIHGRAETPGDLNFMVTDLVRKYLQDHGLSYQTCNDIVGALDNAKDEFKRRIQNPYEDDKIKENGDVYGTLDSYR